MSVTDELRRMLDERGVEYDAHDGNAIKNTYWDYNGRRWGYTDNANNSDIVTPKLSLISKQLTFTPEQVIAATLGGNGKSRYAELFGTPERAARTICRQLKHFNICICDGCPVKPPNKECDSEYDALLEWLRGDA